MLNVQLNSLKKEGFKMTQKTTRNILFVIIFIFSMGFYSPAMAYTSCVGGTEIEANDYTDEGAPSTCTEAYCPSPAKSFCRSNNSMNWWSAFNWCKSNGGTLANFSSMCPGIRLATNSATGACPALQGVGNNQYVWTSMGSGNAYAFLVNLSSGAISAHGNRNGSYGNAFCE